MHLSHSSTRWLTDHRACVRGLAFAPDSQRLATIDDAGVLLLWDAATGKVIQRAQAAPSYSVRAGRALAFTPTGELLVSEPGGLTLRDGRSLAERRRGVPRPHRLQVGGGGAWVLAGESIYTTATLAWQASAPRRLDTEFFAYRLACADPDGDAVLLLDDGGYEDRGMASHGPLHDRHLSLFDADCRTLRRVRVLARGVDDGVTAMAFDRPGHRFVFGTWRGSIEAWTADGAHEAVLARVDGPIDALLCSTHTSMAVHIKRRRLLCWQGCFAGTPTEVELPDGYSFTLSPDGHWLCWTRLPAGESFPIELCDLRRERLCPMPDDEPGVLVQLGTRTVTLWRLRPEDLHADDKPQTAQAPLRCDTCGGRSVIAAPVTYAAHDDDHFAYRDVFHASTHRGPCARCGAALALDLGYTVSTSNSTMQSTLTLDAVRDARGCQLASAAGLTAQA